MAERNHTSQSEITLGRRCKRAWKYRYRDRLRRKRPFRAPLIGTILHEMLDHYVRATNDPKFESDPWKVFAKYEKKYSELFREEREEYGDIPATVEAVFEGYLRRWKNDDLIYESTEVEIEAELMKGVALRCKLDKIVTQRKSGLRFLTDHKFHARIPDAQDRFADIQTLLYFWAWNLTHSKEDRLAGIIWDYGRMKAPAIPELLKGGELTRRSNIDTDSFTYMRTIRDNGLNARDYKDMLESLRGKENTFFERVTLPSPSKALVESVVEDARITVRELRALPDYTPRDGMSMFNCRGCEFRAVCEAELRGLDFEFVKKRDYVIRDEEEREFANQGAD
jgi:hypothetical protein